MIFMRSVPPELVHGVASGLYNVTGSVVRDVASGRGIAFLQETGMLQTILNSVMTSGGNPVVAFANLGLGAASVIQNQQIKSRLVEVQSSLAVLQNLQIGTLAVSGLGLGVSVVGVTSRKVIWLFLEQVRLEFVPVLQRLQGRLAAQG